MTIVLLFLTTVLTSSTAGVHMQSQAIIRGQLLDKESKTPVAGYKLSIDGSSLSTVTDSRGSFSFDSVPVGPVTIIATNLQRPIFRSVIQAGEIENIVVYIEQLQYTETVTGESPLSEAQDSFGLTIGSGNLIRLAPVSVSDPIRGITSLPGVAGNDDLNNQLVLRGAGSRQIAFIIDGVQTYVPTHTIGEGQGGGSISSLNAQNIGSIALFQGNASARYGEGTGGTLIFETKENNGNKHHFVINSGMMNSSVSIDGPFDGKRGGYLASARYSYMNYVLRRMNRTGTNLDFSDVQSRSSYQLSDSNQIGLTTIQGRSSANRHARQGDGAINNPIASSSDNQLWIGHWNFAPSPSLVLQSRLFLVSASNTNVGPAGLLLSTANFGDRGFRQEAMFQHVPAHLFSAGIYYRHNSLLTKQANVGHVANSLVSGHIFRKNTFGQTSIYFQDEFRLARYLCALTAGVRLEASGLTRESVLLPRLSSCFNLSRSSKIRAGFSKQAQAPQVNVLSTTTHYPTIPQMERSTQFNLIYDQLINNHFQLSSELFLRHDSRMMFTFNSMDILNSQSKLVDALIRNYIEGQTNGIEIKLRDTAEGPVTGWISYTLTKTIFSDVSRLNRFRGNHDQRHTLSAYTRFQLAPTVESNILWRYGSGFPLVGIKGNKINRQQLPGYSRLDFRVTKQLVRARYEMSFNFEILNLLGKLNLRQVDNRLEPVLPFFPAGSITVRFK